MKGHVVNPCCCVPVSIAAKIVSIMHFILMSAVVAWIIIVKNMNGTKREYLPYLIVSLWDILITLFLICAVQNRSKAVVQIWIFFSIAIFIFFALHEVFTHERFTSVLWIMCSVYGSASVWRVLSIWVIVALLTKWKEEDDMNKHLEPFPPYYRIPETNVDSSGRLSPAFVPSTFSSGYATSGRMTEFSSAATM